MVETMNSCQKKYERKELKGPRLISRSSKRPEREKRGVLDRTEARTQSWGNETETSWSQGAQGWISNSEVGAGPGSWKYILNEAWLWSTDIWAPSWIHLKQSQMILYVKKLYLSFWVRCIKVEINIFLNLRLYDSWHLWITGYKVLRTQAVT